MVLALSVPILFTCFYPKGKVCKICIIIQFYVFFWYLIQTFVMLVNIASLLIAIKMDIDVHFHLRVLPRATS